MHYIEHVINIRDLGLIDRTIFFLVIFNTTIKPQYYAIKLLDKKQRSITQNYINVY
jgi:hypothetical protein